MDTFIWGVGVGFKVLIVMMITMSVIAESRTSQNGE